MKRVVLFDMDGTLTDARKKIDWDMVIEIRELSRYAEIGIVTGSDLNYLREQCSMLWREINSCDPNNVTLLPCNGTKHLKWCKKQKDFIPVNTVDMREKVGSVVYRKLIENLVKVQDYFITYTSPSCPLSGTFLSYRGSLLNYCPIGRDSNDEDREAFRLLDDQNIIRCRLIDRLKSDIPDLIDSFEIRLGGETSIDIFPKGWNKTYALRFYQDHDVHFVGDRCELGGNDHDIYLAVKKGNGHKTINTDDTKRIIKNLINSFKSEDTK